MWYAHDVQGPFETCLNGFVEKDLRNITEAPDSGTAKPVTSIFLFDNKYHERRAPLTSCLTPMLGLAAQLLVRKQSMQHVGNWICHLSSLFTLLLSSMSDDHL